MTNPIKYTFKSEIFPIVLLVASFVLGIYFYQHFPDRVATHWNYIGQPDGYSGKFFGALGLPLIFLGMYLLFLGLPFLDPKRERYQDFANTYLKFRNAIIFCMFLIFIASGFNNLGYNVPIDKTVSLSVGLLMIFIGNLMGKIKNNWFVGIRTPWTLSSENVWNKTHRMGGFMFVIFGLLIIAAPYLGKTLGLMAFILGVALAVFSTFGYSYWIYRKERQVVSSK